MVDVSYMFHSHASDARDTDAMYRADRLSWRCKFVLHDLAPTGALGNNKKIASTQPEQSSSVILPQYLNPLY
jgi:hypothetical protein